jgi:hypothetical protein
MSNLYSLLVLNDLIHLGFESFDLEPDKGYPNQNCTGCITPSINVKKENSTFWFIWLGLNDDQNPSSTADNSSTIIFTNRISSFHK